MVHTLVPLSLLILLTCYPAVSEMRSGTLIVLNKSDNTAMLIDLSTGEMKATIPTGTSPHEVAVSPDGKWAVVSNYGRREAGNTVTVIDVEAGKKAKEIVLGTYHRPHGLCWLRNTPHVLVTAEGEKNLLVVNVETGKVEKVIGTDQDVSHMVEASLNDRRAFVTNIGSGSVTVIDLEIGKVVKSLPTGAGAEGIALSPDGRELWVTNRAANTLSIFDTESLEILDTLETGEFPIRVKFTPDSTYALVSNARSANVSVFDTKERKEVRKISFEVEAGAETQQRLFGDRFGKGPVPIGIVIHPDGQFAYVANSNADVVAVIDLKAWKVVDWIKAGREPDGLGWSAVKVQGSGRQ